MHDWAWRGSNVRVAPRTDPVTGLAVVAATNRRPSWNQRLGRYSHTAVAMKASRREPSFGSENGRKAQLLLDAGQLGGRLKEVIHRVLALQGRDLGEVRVLKIDSGFYLSHKSEFPI